MAPETTRPASDPGYARLDEKALPAYLVPLAGIAGTLGGGEADWRAREVGDGNLNLVFIVEGPEGGVVVKQALPFVRLVGESWPLPLSRSHYEHAALVAQARLAPGLVPAILARDEARALIVMEWLRPHVIMRKGLSRGIVYPRFAGDIARFLARTLFHTSAIATGADAHKARIAAFAGNTALCRITEDLVFTDPYRDAPLNRWTRPYLDDLAYAFRADGALKRAAQERKFQFISSAEALIHGDLHTGSIMVTQDDTRVIDPEFAFVGPMGFDIGAVLGNLLIAFFAQSGHEPEPGARDSYRTWILEILVEVWERFESEFLALWRASREGDAFVAALFVDAPCEAEAMRDAFMRRLLADSIAYAGLKMIRRVLGLAHVEDFEQIADPARRATCERRALMLARRLVVDAARFATIGEVAEGARATFSAAG